jgi:hypothetical protein
MNQMLAVDEEKRKDPKSRDNVSLEIMFAWPSWQDGKVLFLGMILIDTWQYLYHEDEYTILIGVQIVVNSIISKRLTIIVSALETATI